MLWARVEGSVGFEETLRRRDGSWSIVHRRRGLDQLAGHAVPCNLRVVSAVEPFDGALGPRAVRLDALPCGGDALRARVSLLVNRAVQIDWLAADENSPVIVDYENDQCVFSVDGAARLVTPFGVLEIGAGECAVIPRAVAHRWELPYRFFRGLVVSFCNELSLPNGSFSAGLPLLNSPLYIRDVRCSRWVVANSLVANDTKIEVVFRRGNKWWSAQCRDDPTESVGWEGAVWPFGFGWEAPLRRGEVAKRTLTGEGATVGFCKNVHESGAEPGRDQVALVTTVSGEAWLGWRPAGVGWRESFGEEALASGVPVVSTEALEMTANMAVMLTR